MYFSTLRKVKERKREKICCCDNEHYVKQWSDDCVYFYFQVDQGYTLTREPVPHVSQPIPVPPSHTGSDPKAEGKYTSSSHQQQVPGEPSRGNPPKNPQAPRKPQPYQSGLEPKWAKNVRLLLKNRNQAGRKLCKRPAEPEPGSSRGLSADPKPKRVKTTDTVNPPQAPSRKRALEPEPGSSHGLSADSDPNPKRAKTTNSFNPPQAPSRPLTASRPQKSEEPSKPRPLSTASEKKSEKNAALLMRWRKVYARKRALATADKSDPECAANQLQEPSRPLKTCGPKTPEPESLWDGPELQWVKERHLMLVGREVFGHRVVEPEGKSAPEPKPAKNTSSNQPQAPRGPLPLWDSSEPQSVKETEREVLNWLVDSFPNWRQLIPQLAPQLAPRLAPKL